MITLVIWVYNLIIMACAALAIMAAYHENLGAVAGAIVMAWFAGWRADCLEALKKQQYVERLRARGRRSTY